MAFAKPGALWALHGEAGSRFEDFEGDARAVEAAECALLQARGVIESLSCPCSSCK